MTDDKKFRRGEYPTGCPGKNWDDGLEFNDKQLKNAVIASLPPGAPEKNGMMCWNLTINKKKTPSWRGTKPSPNYANQHPNHVRSRNATCTALGKSVTRSRNLPKIIR
jgi:hypothetical protein